MRTTEKQNPTVKECAEGGKKTIAPMRVTTQKATFFLKKILQ